MPDGIVGANDGFFGNFLLGYNPNADVYINNSNLNMFIGGASLPSGGDVNISLRALGLGQTGVNLYTVGAFIGNDNLNLSLEGTIPSGSANLNLYTVGSTSGYKNKSNHTNLYIAGTIPTSNDHLNITVVSPNQGSMNDAINISIPEPDSKYNRNDNINLTVNNQTVKYIETLNLSIQNTGNLASGHMNISVFGYPVSKTGINMTISGGVPTQTNSHMNMMIQGPKSSATGLNITIKPSLLMPKGININMLGGR